MDVRLVFAEARGRCAEGVLHSRKPARRAGRCQLRPMPAEHQDSPQGVEGRVASGRAKLLPSLPTGRAACRAGRYVNQPRRISLCQEKPQQKVTFVVRPKTESAMRNKKE